MPKSRVRKGRSTVEAREVLSPLDSIRESPRWFAPVMVAAFLLGLFWIVVFYVSGTNYPIPGIKNWNMVVGFVFIGIGFTFATRWK